MELCTHLAAAAIGYGMLMVHTHSCINTYQYGDSDKLLCIADMEQTHS